MTKKAEDAVTALCGMVMRGYASALEAARPEAPILKAKDKLGERFLDVATRAMRERVKAELLGEAAKKNADDLRHCGELAARAIVTGIVVGAIQDTIAAAGIAA